MIRSKFMLMGSSLLFCSLVFCPLRAKASPGCVEDTIKVVSDDGSVLVMASAIAFSVDAGDQPDAMTWLPGEDVSICVLSNSEIKIVNLDQDGASVSAEAQ